MKPVALQRCDLFVGRTMNWLYDHLRHVPRHVPLILCDALQNREEFPELTAWELHRYGLVPRLRRGLGLRPRAVTRALRRSPCVLHTHFGYVALGDFELREELGVPWVVGFYGADVYQARPDGEAGEPYARLFAACARALALGPSMARRLETLGCPADKIAVHPLGVATADVPHRPRPWKPDDGPLEVLFAGTIREKKGAEYALRGVARARAAGVPIRLQLVGSPAAKPGDRETEEQVRATLAELDLADTVARRPLLPFRDLLELSSRCHVFLAPSVTAADGDAEGTPFVLQQMMASGMPVIATRHSDIPFVFGELERLLVDERDAAAIGDRLVEYAETPDLLVEHGRLLREQIVRSFDVRDRAEALSGIYESL